MLELLIYIRFGVILHKNRYQWPIRCLCKLTWCKDLKKNILKCILISILSKNGWVHNFISYTGLCKYIRRVCFKSLLQDCKFNNHFKISILNFYRVFDQKNFSYQISCKSVPFDEGEDLSWVGLIKKSSWKNGEGV